MKLPALQFFVGDWRKDVGVQSLSYHDRGVWFELLCLMFESQHRGKLILNGQAMKDDAIARLLGLDAQVCKKSIQELLATGVASQCPETGALMSRRMIRDEQLRQVRKECGKLGGNPDLLNQNTTIKDKVTTNQIHEDENEDEEHPRERGSGGKPNPVDPELKPAPKAKLKAEAEELLDYLNLKAGRKFRATEENLKLIRARLDTVAGDLPGVKVMIDRQCKLWQNTEIAEYLQPLTLFGKSKFGGYYDKRNDPIATDINHRPHITPDHSKGF